MSESELDQRSTMNVLWFYRDLLLNEKANLLPPGPKTRLIDGGGSSS